MRRIVTTLVVLGLVGGAAVAGARAWQRKLVYFPDTTDPGPATRVHPTARDVTLHTEDGLDLGAWFVPAREDRDRGWAVLVLPGNGGNRSGRAGLADLLSRQGLSVLLVDYRGYGGNPGAPSEEGLAQDADAAVQFLKQEGYDADRTIYLGESLGTGVAAALATRQPPAGLVLRSPFTELADVGAHHYPWVPVRLLLRDRFPVVEHVRDSAVPTTVVHGTADDIVPSALSAEVAAAVQELVEERVLPGVGHNDAPMFGSEVVAAVRRLVDHLDTL